MLRVRNDCNWGRIGLIAKPCQLRHRRVRESIVALNMHTVRLAWGIERPQPPVFRFRPSHQLGRCGHSSSREWNSCGALGRDSIRGNAVEIDFVHGGDLPQPRQKLRNDRGNARFALLIGNNVNSGHALSLSQERAILSHYHASVDKSHVFAENSRNCCDLHLSIIW